MSLPVLHRPYAGLFRKSHCSLLLAEVSCFLRLNLREMHSVIMQSACQQAQLRAACLRMMVYVIIFQQLARQKRLGAAFPHPGRNSPNANSALQHHPSCKLCARSDGEYSNHEIHEIHKKVPATREGHPAPRIPPQRALHAASFVCFVYLVVWRSAVPARSEVGSLKSEVRISPCRRCHIP